MSPSDANPPEDGEEARLKAKLLWLAKNNPLDPHKAPEDQLEALEAYFGLLDRKPERNSARELFEEIKEVATASGFLVTEMYKATGLYGDFLQTCGVPEHVVLLMDAGALKTSRSQTGSELTKDDVDRMLKERIPRSPEAIALVRQLMDMAAHLEASWKAFSGDSANFEVAELLKPLLKDCLESAKRFEI